MGFSEALVIIFRDLFHSFSFEKSSIFFFVCYAVKKKILVRLRERKIFKWENLNHFKVTNY